MNTKKAIGIVWLVVGLIYLFSGLDNIYDYSTPGVLWYYIIPIAITYLNIFCGIICLKIGLNFLKKKTENQSLILPLTFLLLFYVISDFIIYGLVALNYSVINFISIILIAFSIKKLPNVVGISKMTSNLSQNKATLIGILILGFIPYLLAEFTDYDDFIFLH